MRRKRPKKKRENTQNWIQTPRHIRSVSLLKAGFFFFFFLAFLKGASPTRRRERTTTSCIFMHPQHSTTAASVVYTRLKTSFN